jgi:hypothetical protein
MRQTIQLVLHEGVKHLRKISIDLGGLERIEVLRRLVIMTRVTVSIGVVVCWFVC